ncbi:unnamed protein product [Arctogadus glacialis]
MRGGDLTHLNQFLAPGPASASVRWPYLPKRFSPDQMAGKQRLHPSTVWVAGSSEGSGRNRQPNRRTGWLPL